MGLKSFVVGLEEILPELSPDDRATTVLRRADQARPSAYQDLAEPLWFPGGAGGKRRPGGACGLRGALSDSTFIPRPGACRWCLAAALAVALLPRIGLAASGHGSSGSGLLVFPSVSAPSLRRWPLFIS